jgi:hypothetical protein
VKRRVAAAARSQVASVVVLAAALVLGVLASAGATTLVAANVPEAAGGGAGLVRPVPVRVVPPVAPWSLPDPHARLLSIPEARGLLPDATTTTTPTPAPATSASVSAVAAADRTPPAAPDRPDGAPSPRGTLGIPVRVLQAYQAAAGRLRVLDPGCRVRWEVVAAIGRLESGHARGGRVRADGTTFEPILGPVLDGSPFRAIRDSDGGRLDGNATWDRAVGPMQFLPGTWAGSGRDGDGDGRRNPHDIDDAATAAAGYLCLGAGDLSNRSTLAAAVLRYNRSSSYVAAVLSWADAYAAGRAVPVAGPPEPRRSATPTPKSKPKPKPSARPSPTATTKPTATPGRTATPTPTASPSPSARPTASPTPTETPEPSPAPSRTATPSPTASRTAAAEPTPAGTPSSTPAARTSATPTGGGASPSGPAEPTATAP